MNGTTNKNNGLAELKQKYKDKIDELSPKSFNKDQKELAKSIIDLVDEDTKLQSIFQLLVQRVKIGFTFDIAPYAKNINNRKIALLKRNDELSFEGKNSNTNALNKDLLIIGENYDVLNNLLVIERERESRVRI
ncbi:hypothetical protein [Mycoplasmopsis verecunda]|uniref:Type III restriction-modification system: methylase n=1 Tax=Mycoplasmopsis verecunda TaxID=171291 RepID=A0A1T4KFZ8_9BACT|nr:hypothetical protein [Mycoplasmopsis verecunda]WPB54894.1 type III restriction endonuclease subunit M [Mycoplasmopsis verecunda]SJZ41263.1 hypothetical protein SAMN02745154_00042 [Mycoplasmopsis verecunda]